VTFTPPPHLSPSSIGTWKQCPLKFKYQKIDGLREPPTEATLMGNFVHEVFEELYATDPDDRTLDTARMLSRKLWNEKYEEEVAFILSKDKHNTFRWNSWFCIENLWGIEEPTETTVDEIELELNGKLGGVQLKGFIDRLCFDDDGSIIIGDYKTGKVPAPKWEDDKFSQLFIYAALCRELEIGEAKRLDLIYLKAPKVISRKVTDDKIEAITADVVQVKKEIDESCNNEQFEARKAFLCNWCYFKKQCPAWR
jgi:putative RecB family exonuclease